MAYETANKRFQKLHWEIIALELAANTPEITNKKAIKYFKKLAVEKNEEVYQLVRQSLKEQDDEDEKEEVV